MHREVSAAVDFIASLLYHRLPRRRVVHLCEQLRQDMLTHQFSLSEMSGLQIEGPRDPLLMRAAQQAGLQPMEVARQLPQDLALWIQPGRVAVRIDKNDHATLLNSDSDTADNLPQARWRAATGSTSSYFTAEEFARTKFGSTKLRQERRQGRGGGGCGGNGSEGQF
ncbi:hypothetical protein BOX15_Mlig004858g2 [Macrostomum lignano]|uniref:Anti-proliferative protein domain-containing protein n=1 Tax=Macrostomum lignano TaxID=282301 RepID=A0A267FY25_9PLAT|nr:hypothetical protein BOX15_Mlig004858g1 [Macrostomum lignano]PAA78715.1 hypothetical protein BOX15_Mlig004858g4 [Macrostomum lignano]PAA83726.1 hypothetical protein BOX15_Mlig004858g2 [Macrostomum lignano]